MLSTAINHFGEMILRNSYDNSGPESIQDVDERTLKFLFQMFKL